MWVKYRSLPDKGLDCDVMNRTKVESRSKWNNRIDVFEDRWKTLSIDQSCSICARVSVKYLNSGI